MQKQDIQSYKDLNVWQGAMDLAESVYIYTNGLPKEERYGLVNQMRRAAVSVPSNIAEGHSRRGARDYMQFVSIAIGSAAELETQILLAQRLKYGETEVCESILFNIKHVRRMLHALRNALDAKDGVKKTAQPFLDA